MRCFSTVISGMFGLLEKCKESEGGLSRVQGYGRRGVIRKALSRAGKFKDHDGEGLDSTLKIFTESWLLVVYCTKRCLIYQSRNIIGKISQSNIDTELSVTQPLGL